MSTGFYPRYDQLGASSRYRFFTCYNEWLKRDPSADILLKPGLSDTYLKKLYRTGRVPLIRGCWENFRMLMRGFSLPEKLIIEYELVPNLAYKYEKFLIGGRPYILNYDDNVWVKYQNKPALLDKYDQLCRNAAGVITANSFLYEKVSALNKNVIIIPTVVDLEKYQSAQAEKSSVFTAAWIGSPVTYCYLEKHLDMLQKVFGNDEAQLLVIANENLQYTRPLKGVNARYVNWSEESEINYIKECHIGIMPLCDDEFSRGKSAFKLLQYQAAGLPLAASPVGENKNVVIPGENGFLADSPEEWLNSITLLRTDHMLYEKCQRVSLQRAYEYSLQKYFPVFMEFVKRSLNI